jgi:hypothetical protein
LALPEVVIRDTWGSGNSGLGGISDIGGSVTMRLKILFALLPAMLVAACTGDSGTVYPVSMDRARQIVSKADLPPVLGIKAPRVQAQSNKPTEVILVVNNNGSEMMRYTATLTEAGQGKTRIALELKGSKGGPAGDVEKRFLAHPNVRNLYLVAMKEKISSQIEGRPLDMAKINAALGGGLIGHMGDIHRSADEAAKASEKL